MDAIRTYIDNVFKAFPPGEKVDALKRDMLTGMEEKYHALKDAGKSEHEAVGSVIADFGNIDEVAAELGINQNSVESATLEDGISLSNEDARNYIEQTKKSGLWIGLGVWLILAGVAAMTLIGGLVSNGDGAVIIGPAVIANPQEMSGSLGLGIFILFVSIAIAVTLFIIHGMKLSPFEEYQSINLLLDDETRSEFEEERKQFMPKFTAAIAVGVAVIIAAVGGFVLYSTIGQFEDGGVATLMLAVGFSVVLFVRFGLQYGAYDVLLGMGDYKHKTGVTRNAEVERMTSTVAAVYWPLTTAVYLAWSFITGSWNISWVVWPIAGVLFGAFAGGINVWYSTSKKD